MPATTNKRVPESLDFVLRASMVHGGNNNIINAHNCAFPILIECNRDPYSPSRIYFDCIHLSGSSLFEQCHNVIEKI